MIKSFLEWSSRASSGSGIGALTNIIIVGVVWAVLGVVVVKLITYANTLNLSQNAMDVLYFMVVAYGVSGFLWLIAQVISHWMNEKSMMNQGV